MGGEVLGIFIPITWCLVFWNIWGVFVTKRRYKAVILLILTCVIFAISAWPYDQRSITEFLIMYPIFYYPLASIIVSITLHWYKKIRYKLK